MLPSPFIINRLKHNKSVVIECFNCKCNDKNNEQNNPYLCRNVLAVSIARWWVPLWLHCQILLQVYIERIQREPRLGYRCASAHHPLPGIVRIQHWYHDHRSRIYGKTKDPWAPLQFHSMLDAQPPDTLVRHNRQADFLANHAHPSIHNIHQPSPSFLPVNSRHLLHAQKIVLGWKCTVFNQSDKNLNKKQRKKSVVVAAECSVGLSPGRLLRFLFLLLPSRTPKSNIVNV